MTPRRGAHRGDVTGERAQGTDATTSTSEVPAARQGEGTPAETAGAPRPASWYIGRCQTGCKFGVKLRGTVLIEEHRFAGFLDEEGNRIQIPRCPEHQRRPFLHELRIGPATGKRCNASCWNARSDYCECPCQGENHGTGHALVPEPEQAVSEPVRPPQPARHGWRDDPATAPQKARLRELLGTLAGNPTAEKVRNDLNLARERGFLTKGIASDCLDLLFTILRGES